MIRVIEGEEVKPLAEAMVAYGERTGKRNFCRDGTNIAASEAMVLIGLKDARITGVNCGACGAETCAALAINSREAEFCGPQRAMRALDMGIALGSAVKMAGLLNADNRIMYRAVVAARELGLVDADFVMGVPLSATGKSIYFDR